MRRFWILEIGYCVLDIFDLIPKKEEQISQKFCCMMNWTIEYPSAKADGKE